MQTEHSSNAPLIDLMGRSPNGPADTPTPTSPLDMGMTLAQLSQNFDTILQRRAIFYPVGYHFVKELGRGRQGRVYLVLRQGARGCTTEYAIKILDPGPYRSPEEYWTDMGRIASQISQLQRLQCSNLVSRHSYEETYGIGYIQMEAIDGINIEDLLDPAYLAMAKARSTPGEWDRWGRSILRIKDDAIALQPGMAVHIMQGILRGLERVHAAGFLHFDIKPANVMIDRLGAVKIVDFGRAVKVGEHMTFLFGSPMYMAPETHRREPAGPQTDIYSVGLLGLEILRGARLVDRIGASEDELLAAKMDLPQRIPELLPADVRENDPFVAIMQKLLAPDPRHRFATAAEAESSEDGLRLIDKQLVRADLDSDYARDLSGFLSAFVNTESQRIELPRRGQASASQAS